MTDTPRDQEQPADEFGLHAVRELLHLIRETDVTEIQIERAGVKLHVKRGGAQQSPFMMTPALAAQVAAAQLSSAAPQAAIGHAPAAPAAPATAEYESSSGSHTIVSPMVGTYYSSPSPKDPVYVHEGDTVQIGDVVGIVEAMKIMNEVDSEYAGRLARILVKHGQPVEYGQPLMIIEPT